eukprot:TRINITY_DN114789_c0_g1_i1.p1 TRINITY_DN114789_c0_g1~~TRINITY_DN114789_c0_g1_i1.p1  ORF type:complete len:256 (-),score=73.52 TRINITY_DN114789_c0_g1_i1:131-898(-)
MAIGLTVFAGIFFAVVAIAAGLMAYVAWKGNKHSDFFADAVQSTYSVQLDEAAIDAYFDLKDRMRKQRAPDAPADDEDNTWIRSVLVPEERRILQHALMRRMVAIFDKLDQVQKDKPGHFKLWQQKLCSEKVWQSLLEAEQMISEEINSCQNEADVLEPGWKDHIFGQAVQIWREARRQEELQKQAKKAHEKEKKGLRSEKKKEEKSEQVREEDRKREEKAAEKAMEALLKEEEAAAKGGAKKRASVDKSKSKKK